MQGKSSEPPWFTSPASDPAEPDGGRLGSIWSFLGPIVSFSGQRHFVTEYWIDPFGHFTEKTKPCHHEYYVLTDAPQRGVVAKGERERNMITNMVSPRLRILLVVFYLFGLVAYLIAA